MKKEDPRVLRTRKDVVSAALDILLSQGWNAVTHAEVAQRSGYSRATIYSHWPTQMDLVSAAFEDFQDMPHFVPTGELRSDLLGELESFSHAMVEYHLDRALAMLAEKAQTSHDVVGIRDSFVTAGEKPMRQTLEHADSLTAEAITMMLCGMVTHSVLMHGKPPQHEVLTKAVDLLLAGTDLS